MSSWSPQRRFIAFYLIAVAIVAGVTASRVAAGGDGGLSGLIAFLGESGLYANSLSIARYALTDPRILLVFVFAGSPTIAAVLVSSLSGGRPGLRSLLSRLKPWLGVSKAQGLSVYVWLGVIYVVGAVAYFGSAAAWGKEDAVHDILSGLGGSWVAALLWLAIGPFIDEGGTWEELGWRGFGLPLLLDRMRSPLGATMAIGFLWWAWHFPREIVNLMGGVVLPIWAFWQAVFLLLCLALSVVITLAWFKTGGSVWPAILIHGFTNVWSKALSGPLYEVTGTDARTWIVVSAAAIVLVVTKGRLGAPVEA